MLRRASSNLAEVEPDEPAPLRLEGEQIVVPRVERRKGERRGMEALRAEALQAVISQVEDRQFGGLREKISDTFSWPRSLKPSRLILVFVALLAGGLAAFLAMQRETPLTDAPVQQIVVAPPVPVSMQILVAKQAIGMGQRLTPDSVEWRSWPESEVQPEYINNAATPEAITDMGGTVARFEFFPGEPIRQEKLVTTDQGYLSAVLERGMRGVSVTVNASAASGGFIVPNDHVDVVLTRSTENGQVAQTILRNVRVLAINTRLGETGTTGAPADPNNPRAEIFSNEAIATLALDSAQSEIIIDAAADGRLSLVLRSIADFADGQGIDANQQIRMTSPFWTK